MMPDLQRGDEARLDAALEALQRSPEVTTDHVARVAARAVLANAPAMRTRRTLLRAASVVVMCGLGALAVARSGTRPATHAAVSSAPSGVATLPTVDVAVTGARPIIFELDAPTAGSVQVLGDFNGWSRDADRMQRNADGRWRLTTMLPPGRYVYAYLIDGRQFVRDPMREPVEDRDFGVTGSELVIGEAP